MCKLSVSVLAMMAVMNLSGAVKASDDGNVMIPKPQIKKTTGDVRREARRNKKQTNTDVIERNILFQEMRKAAEGSPLTMGRIKSVIDGKLADEKANRKLVFDGPTDETAETLIKLEQVLQKDGTATLQQITTLLAEKQLEIEEKEAENMKKVSQLLAAKYDTQDSEELNNRSGDFYEIADEIIEVVDEDFVQSVKALKANIASATKAAIGYKDGINPELGPLKQNLQEKLDQLKPFKGSIAELTEIYEKIKALKEKNFNKVDQEEIERIEEDYELIKKINWSEIEN